MTAGISSVPEVRALLATLVAAKPGGRIAEAGTAFGEGAKSMAAALTGGATLLTVEHDPERYEVARVPLEELGVEAILGRWEDVLPTRGPFDVLFVDAGVMRESLEVAIGLLATGGILVKDDLTPGREIDSDWVRAALLRDPRLLAVEVQVREGMAVIVAVRR